MHRVTLAIGPVVPYLVEEYSDVLATGVPLFYPNAIVIPTTIHYRTVSVRTSVISSALLRHQWSRWMVCRGVLHLGMIHHFCATVHHNIDK